MAKKWIPNGDHDFRQQAEAYARQISKDPARFGVSAADAEALGSAVKAFADAYDDCHVRSTRSPLKTSIKEQARRDAEAIMRRLHGTMRANGLLHEQNRILLGLPAPATRKTPDTLPDEAPRLHFVRAVHEAGFVPHHELQFSSQAGPPRPAGATRLELFVDLIPVDANLDQHYAKTAVNRPVYVRSYAKSPIRLVPPMADRPMRVVYWARWADAEGNVGPMSTPVAAWVEGGTHHLMHALTKHRPEATTHVTVSPEAITHETTVMIALLSGQASRQFTAPPVMRQLEAPVEDAAA